MGNCKDCAYWGTARKGREAATVCDRIDWEEFGHKVTDSGAELYADALDDSGLDVRLKTGPEFGCALFIPRKR